MNPVSPVRNLHLVNRLINAQDWPRLLEASRAWLAEDPESPVAHRTAGQALLNLERHKEAQQHLAKALALQPDHGFAHRMASMAAFHLKDFARADEHIQRGLELQPNDALHWHHLAHMRYQHGEMDLAAKHAARALELQPRNPAIINLVALCERKSGYAQYQHYRHALAIDPENSTVHNNLGVHYLNVDRDYELAEKSFRQALRLNPTDKTAQKNLLVVLRHRDRLYQAMRFPLTLVQSLSWSGSSRTLLARVGLVGMWLLLGKVFWGILILWFVLVYPLVKAYEYLTIGDIQAEAGTVGARRGGLLGYRRWPFAVRFGLLVVLTLALWGGIYGLYQHTPEFNPALLGGFISLTVFGYGLYLIQRHWGKARLRRLARRSEKKLARRVKPTEGQARFPASADHERPHP